MRLFISLYLICLLVIPDFAKAQFTGFQDETVSGLPTWIGDSGFMNADTSYTNDPTTFGAEGDYTVSGSVDINVTGPSSRCFLGSKTLDGYVDYFGCAIRVAVLPFIFTLALVSFIWGVTSMMRHPANEEAQSKGRIFILWGIIGFFVITSVYALVAIIRRTVGFGSNFENDGTPYVLLKEKMQNLK